MLRAKLYGLRKEFSIDDVIEHMRILGEGEKPLVIYYEAKGKNYLQIQDFGQRIRTEKNPGPPPDFDTLRANASKCAQMQASRARTHTPPNTNTQAHTASHEVLLGKKERKKETAPAPPDPPPPSVQESPIQFPSTNTEINRVYPGSGPEVSEKLVSACRQIEPGIEDAAVALAVRAVGRWAGDRSAYAIIPRICKYLRSMPPEERGKTGPQLVPARASPPVKTAAQERDELRRLGEQMMREEYAAQDRAASGGD